MVVKKTLKNNHGKGNRDAQKKRRKERLKNRPPKQDQRFLLIDGNWSHYPEGFCVYHCAFMTQGLLDTHRCVQRKCQKFRKVVDGEISEDISS